MSLKNGLTLKVVSLAVVLVFCLGLIEHGQAASGGKVFMAEPSIPVLPETVARVADALYSWRPVDAPYFAITDVVNYQDGYSYISVAGVTKKKDWNIFDDAIWTGTVVLWDNGGAVLEQAAKVGRDPLGLNGVSMAGTQEEEPDPAAQLISFDMFPWENGKKAVIGPSGVHAAWAAYPGWLALDFLSGSDLGDGWASAYAYSLASGIVTYVCRDGNNAAIEVDITGDGAADIIYVHLVSNVDVHQGTALGKGQRIGMLKMGTFTNLRCGHAEQVSNHWHLHFGFKSTENVQFEDCTLNISAGEWDCTNPSRDGTFPLRSTFVAKWQASPTGGGSVSTLRENIWFPLLDGIISRVIALLSGLPVSETTGAFASDAIGYADWVITIVWLVTTLHFNMTVPLIVFGAITVLEIARWFYTTLLMGKKLLPRI